MTLATALACASCSSAPAPTAPPPVPTRSGDNRAAIADDGPAGPENHRCDVAIAHMKTVFGDDFDAALKRGILTRSTAMTRSQLAEDCARWSIWTHQCIVLSPTQEQIHQCSPLNEPLIRESYAGVPENELNPYHQCLVEAQKRSDLDTCLAEARARSRR